MNKYNTNQNSYRSQVVLSESEKLLLENIVELGKELQMLKHRKSTFGESTAFRLLLSAHFNKTKKQLQKEIQEIKDEQDDWDF